MIPVPGVCVVSDGCRFNDIYHFLTSSSTVQLTDVFFHIQYVGCTMGTQSTLVIVMNQIQSILLLRIDISLDISLASHFLGSLFVLDLLFSLHPLAIPLRC